MTPTKALRSCLLGLALSAAVAGAPPPAWAQSDAAVEAAARAAGFSKQTVKRGQHRAWLLPWATTKSAISYQAQFNSTAIYTFADQDQYDYNKLPGIADCGTIDLAKHGAMFGWRWNPRVQKLQISAYANANGAHQFHDNNPTTVTLVELSRDDLSRWAPLRYELRIDGAQYLFSITGTLADGRVIHAQSRLRRGCADRPNRLKVGSHLYFGGTKTAPHDVSAFLRWLSR